MKETILKLIQLIKKQEVEELTSRKDELWRAVVITAQSKQHKQKDRKIAVAMIMVAAVSLGFLIYNTKLFENNTPPIELIASQMGNLAEMSEVTLILSGNKLLEVDDKSDLSLSNKGDLSVNTKCVDENIDKENDHSSYTQLIVPNGKRTSLTLSDNTKLWVNSGTRVVFPRSFSGATREIFIDGEAYLEVSPNKDKPFVVKTKADFEVEVLGTAFNICTYKEMSAATVVLVEGAVRVKDNNNNKAYLSPNQLISISNNSLGETVTVNAEDYISWTKGILVLRSQPLKNVVERLSIHFGEQINIEESIYNIKISGKLELKDDLSTILEGLTNITITPISYSKDKNGVHNLKKE